MNQRACWAALSRVPVQVVHGGRTVYNVRNGWDIARFLGDPMREDVEGHLANLQCVCVGHDDLQAFVHSQLPQP